MPILNWIGKEAVVNHDKEVPFKLLKKVKSASEGEHSQNLIIHGDNLEALKALMPYYCGKIKCVYIDVPYNTGNEDWVYNDKVNSPKIKKWLGKVVGTESEDLCRHDKWLCMMYPRLKLLKELMSEDGVIFVSISEVELFNLKSILDEIFEPNNFMGLITIKSTPGGRQSTKNFALMGDYMLVYGKSEKSEILGIALSEKQKQQYDKEDEQGKYLIGRLRQHGVAEKREDVPSLYFPIFFNEKTGKVSTIKKEGYNVEVLPILPSGGDGRWIWSKPKIEKDKDFILIKKVKRNGGYIWDAFFKKYLNNDMKSNVPNFWDENEFRTEVGTKELKEYFNGEKVFAYPKPIYVIKRVIECSTNPSDIILDSFAGSGTTGHAVLDLNKEDGGSRKFILIEMEDSVAKDITSERIKRVIKKQSYKDGFEFCELDKPLFNEEGQIEAECTFEQLATYIYFTETQTNLEKKKVQNNFIGEFNEIEYYLLFKEKGKNILNKSFLNKIKSSKQKKIIYADKCLIDEKTLNRYNIQFKQIPYEVKVY